MQMTLNNHTVMPILSGSTVKSSKDIVDFIQALEVVRLLWYDYNCTITDLVDSVILAAEYCGLSYEEG